MKRIALPAVLLLASCAASAQEMEAVSTTTLNAFTQAAAEMAGNISARAADKKLSPLKADKAFQKAATELIKRYLGEDISFSLLPMKYPEQAIKLFSGEIAVAPSMPDAYAYRAQAYGKLSRHAEALADYDKALEIDPAHANGRSRKMRGTMNMYLGRTDDAIDDFTKAIDLAPDNSFIYLERAKAYIAKQDFDSAATDMSSFFRLADDESMQNASAGPECSALTAQNYEIPGCASSDTDSPAPQPAPPPQPKQPEKDRKPKI